VHDHVHPDPAMSFADFSGTFRMAVTGSQLR
jgi:hypothetical protein